MKKFLSVLFVLALLIGLAVPAYAAEPYDSAWVPPIPDFITPVENGFRTTCFIHNFLPDSSYHDFVRFMDFEAKECITLLDQGVYNRYKEENNIPYDRQFSIYFVFPRKKTDGSYYDFGAFMHKGGPRHQEQMNTPSPMLYMCLDNPHIFVKYIYDENTNALVLQPGLSVLSPGSSLRFTYVLAVGEFKDVLGWSSDFVNGKFSEPSEIYPGFTQVSGKDFGVGTVYHQFVDGKAVEHWRDYDWWLGIKGDEEIPPYNENFDIDLDTDGDGKPDLNIDTDGDGKPDVNIDTNGDRKPDLNIDTDGDGKPDINIDLDGDGSPDINIDLNGDGKPDLNTDTNGDGRPDVNVDIDGDGKPDVNVKPGSGSGSGEGGSGSGSSSGGGSSTGGSSSGGDSSGGSSTGGSSSGGSSSGGSSEGEGPGSGDDGPGSGGGSSSDKGSGSPDTWFGESDKRPSYDPWEFFDPFKSDYTPAPWDKNYNPTKPGDSIYNGYDPFAVFNNLLKEMFGG